MSNPNIGKLNKGGKSRIGRLPRSQLSSKFIDDFNDAWEKYGKDALTICAKKFPEKFVQIRAALEPKSVEVTATAVVAEMSIEELDRYYAMLDELEAKKALTIDGTSYKLIESKNEPATNE